MAESMVEKVAKAIEDNVASALPSGVAIDYGYASRAAIEAMREPTNAMVDAGVLDTKEDVSFFDVEETYRAMISAALNEEVAG